MPASSIFFFRSSELGLFVLASQLFVDGLDLFVEVVLFLGAFHLAFDARLNRAVQLALFQLQLEQFNQALQASLRGEEFQQSLFVFDGKAQLGSQRVSQVRRIVIAHRGLQRIGLHVRRETQVLLNQLPEFLHQSIEACPFLVHHRGAAHQRHERAFGIFDAHHGGALATFDDDLDLAIVLLL